MGYQIKKILILFLISLMLFFIPAGATQGANLSGEGEVTSSTTETSPKLNETETQYVTIDFDDVDIALFIKFISELTGKNFVIDRAVKANVTIISPTKITVEEAYKVFESVLEVHGFTTVPAGSIIKIVPMTDARSKNIETRVDEEAMEPEDKVVTQLIPLKYANPEEIKKVFGQFISKSSIMVSYAPTGMLIVTDIFSNIKRLLEIIDVIDVPGTGEEISIIPLEYAMADDTATSLNSIFKMTGAGTRATQAKSNIQIVADDRTNSLIILASEVDTLKIRQLIDILDKETPRGQGDIHVYYLQNANAEDLTGVLAAIPSKQSGTAQTGTSSVISRDVQIVADKATNSLIITAKKADYLILEDVIKKLDIPRNMVYIEALIMEVSMSKEFELGVQWYGGKPAGELADTDIGVFGGSNPGSSNFPSVDTGTGTVSLPTGLSLGVLGDTIRIGGIDYPSIAAVARAYGTSADVHILSTPQIIALDNQEAEIRVVDNIPFLSRRGTSAAEVDYSNYEREEVGVILNIIPQINQERFVRLKISQEVSQVVKQGETEGLPTTLKREAKTTVVIKDGQTIVIGGLIDETENKTNYKVPILGDIPILGYLFRSTSSSLDKKNLYIFLTPHIIENPAEAQDLYEDKKSHIDSIEESVIRLNQGRSGQTEDMRLSDLGYGYIQTEDYDKAAEYYEKALAINPNNPYAILNMGFIHEKRGEKGKAAEMYERLIALDPDDKAYISTDPMKTGRKLSDIAKDNLKNLQESIDNQ